MLALVRRARWLPATVQEAGRFAFVKTAETHCILTVHAHPDDESSKGAGSIARYSDAGVRAVLVCCGRYTRVGVS